MSAAIATRRRVAGFTGRTWVLERVNQWLGSTGPAAFLITGLQGTGKSTLANRFVQFSNGEVESKGGGRLGKQFLTYAHFCHGDTDRTTLLPHRFIENISAAIIERHETARDYLTKSLQGSQQVTLTPSLTLSGVVQTGATVKNLEVNIQIGDTSPLVHFDTLVRKPLERLSSVNPDQQIVFLIDGLDEALNLDSPTILDLLRDIKNFPASVRWLDYLPARFQNPRRLGSV